MMKSVTVKQTFASEFIVSTHDTFSNASNFTPNLVFPKIWFKFSRVRFSGKGGKGVESLNCMFIFTLCIPSYIWASMEVERDIARAASPGYASVVTCVYSVYFKHILPVA